MSVYNHNFKKKFGQNFLKDDSIVKKIVNCALIKENSLVIEVGPGGAILTRQLARSATNVIAYEIDYDLADLLKSRLDSYNNVDIKFCDFLSTNISDDIKEYNYDHIYFISNVPYYITTPIIMKLIESNIEFDNIILMVQHEVAERFSSLPGNKSYGSVTVFLNYYFDIKSLFFVSRDEFEPVPNVDSEVISLVPKKNKLYLKDIVLFEKLIKDSFQFKRKNIKNNLKGYPLDDIENILVSHGLSLSSRAEDIDVSIFVEIANKIYDKKNI